MKTKIFKLNDLENQFILNLLCDAIKQNQLVIFPTETVYGIGAYALSPLASTNIYRAKNRPSDNPLIVHIASKSDVNLYVKEVPLKAKILMNHFWPGPLTMIFKKSDIVPFETTGGLNTVALRMPDHQGALKLIEASGPIAAPSANISGKPSSTEFKHVYSDFNGKVAYIIDGGKTLIGLESTVIDVRDQVTLLRPGSITKTMIENILNEPILDQSKDRPTDLVLSPGMKYTHYKPVGNVTLLKGDALKVIAFLNQLDQRIKNNLCIITVNDYIDLFKDYKVSLLGKISDSREIGHNVFSSLRLMDEWSIEHIYIYLNETDEYSQTIMNRLLKASGYQVKDFS
jgi:L-threonylcarbamoyladenylate synthase